MKKRNLLLACGLSIAALFSAPGLLLAYTLIGGSLGVSTSGNGYQRDVRVFNNAADASANNNTNNNVNYPGAQGAPLAVWKGARAWSSDTDNANLPGGFVSKNFDMDWQGAAPDNNSTNQNTVDWTDSGCGGGTLAYTETPISDGWRIRFCESGIAWSDGPGNPGFGQVDIQGVMAHEYGHALGMGHSQNNFCSGGCASNATMCAFICSNGVSERDIKQDDADGLEDIYGAMPGNKPVITSLSGSKSIGQTLVINGNNFAATVNVKFTAGVSKNTGTIDGVVYGVASSGGGTMISVTVPAQAEDGNVLVWQPNTLLSNAFPIDIDASVVPTLNGVSPASLPAFLGGTVTLDGSGFLGATVVTLTDNAGVVFNPSFTAVDDSTITFNSPTVTQLGTATVNVSSGAGTSNDGSTIYTDRDPPLLSCPTAFFVGDVMNWDWQGIANSPYKLFVRRNTLVTGSYLTCTGILAPPRINLSAGVNDPLGIGHYQRFIPGSLAGLTIYSQLVDIDSISGNCSNGSNIVETIFQ